MVKTTDNKIADWWA